MRAVAVAINRSHVIQHWMMSALCALLIGLLASPAFSQTPPETAGAPKKADLLSFIDGDHILGDPKAKVKIIEYASLSCPHCANFHKETFPELKKRYIDTGKAAFVFRHYPLNETAFRGAMLTECVGQDKFFTFLKVLFDTQQKWAFSSDYLESLRAIAGVGGVDAKTFDACMADKAIENRLISGVSWASKELGVNVTPTLFINGEKIESSRSIDTIAPKIDSYLSK